MKYSVRNFYFLLANTVLSSITNFTVWFAIIFFAFLQTQSVLVTSVLSGLYLITVAFSGFWFGSLVDRYRKKSVMLWASAFSLLTYIVGFALYQFAPEGAFASQTSVYLWVLAPLLLSGIIAGNIRGIALPTVITLIIPEENRDKANGMAGSLMGIAFMVVSFISGVLVGHSGMFLVLILAISFTIASMLHLWTIPIPEKKIAHAENVPQKVDIRGTLKVVKAIPGLLALILFTTFNNFLGGVFMSLMDAYGLSMVSVQVWGFIWGFLSLGFIVGGLIIAKKGLGKNPLRALFLANFTIWAISSVFTIQASLPLLMVGMFLYLTVVPYIEAAEHTIIQKLVPLERQGRVFGFAQSVEQAASPLTAFAIGPIAQFVFIPFMTTGAGVGLIGDWFGTGPARGLALVFTLAGLTGLTTTFIAFRSKYYRQLSAQYLKG